MTVTILLRGRPENVMIATIRLKEQQDLVVIVKTLHQERLELVTTATVHHREFRKRPMTVTTLLSDEEDASGTTVMVRFQLETVIRMFLADNSPVRRRASPPRGGRIRHDSDNSPPRRCQEYRSSSPPRRQKSDDSDLSPPRKFRKIEEPKKIKKEEPDSDIETFGKTLDGKRSGLQSAIDLKDESDKLRAKNDKVL